ncbi:MAG TPA: hypothetical protein PLI66_08020, partial [Spirochaetales bacterium]|nr:hypothetical protein [Spirochaetales bacterium]
NDTAVGGIQADIIATGEGDDRINARTRPTAPGSGIDVVDGGADTATLAERLSGSIETISATQYSRMVAEAAAAGEIASDVDPALTAFILDDIFLMIQFSFASTYYRDRLRLFAGGAADDDEAIVAAALAFIRRALERRQS